MKTHKIAFAADTEEAEALLRVLRGIGRREIEMLPTDIPWEIFNAGCTRLRTALRDVVEPGWREREED
jgi:hypothetical protein